jgi:hydrogenase expression/formation protein HypE
MTSAECIQLAHGSGGRRTAELIREEILTRFGGGPLDGLPDGATLPFGGDEIVFTTDGYTVHPLEFPGGTIGALAVHGTVNDIAVSGGIPRWLSLGIIAEEGLPMDVFRRILDDAARAAAQCGVQIATGDTKVVARGACDGLFLHTAGIGARDTRLRLGRGRIRPGDAVLVSGALGDHGMAVMTAREGLTGRPGPVSDTGPVIGLTAAAAAVGDAVRFMRDPTRGGLAAVVNEIVDGASFGAELDEDAIPFSPASRAVADMLGIDLLHVACEGRVVAVCGADASRTLLDSWQSLPEGAGARRIGRINEDPGRVTLHTAVGGRRVVDVPAGELLPRIC